MDHNDGLLIYFLFNLNIIFIITISPENQIVRQNSYLI